MITRNETTMTFLILTALLGLAASVAAEEGEVIPMTPEQLATDSVRVAAVQITGNWIWGHPLPPENDPADQAIAYIERAAADGVDLIAFPELYLGMFRVPSPSTAKIAATARTHRINVTIGCFEVLDEAGNYRNSILVFNRDGEIVGRYFKAFQAVGGAGYGWPPKEDDPEWMMQPGQEFPVFDLDFGRIGILTCYDGYFPEIFRILSLKGAEIILWPNARGGSVEEHIVRTNMQANYVHMLTVNKAVGGGTMVAAWPHTILDVSDGANEDMVVGTLDLANLRNARINAREFHQRRPAIFGELLRNWNVWEQYGVDHPVGIDVPEPSREAHERILRGAGIAFESE